MSQELIFWLGALCGELYLMICILIAQIILVVKK
jgi:hypothetical protein